MVGVEGDAFEFDHDFFDRWAMYIVYKNRSRNNFILSFILASVFLLLFVFIRNIDAEINVRPSKDALPGALLFGGLIIAIVYFAVMFVKHFLAHRISCSWSKDFKKEYAEISQLKDFNERKERYTNFVDEIGYEEFAMCPELRPSPSKQLTKEIDEQRIYLKDALLLSLHEE